MHSTAPVRCGSGTGVGRGVVLPAFGTQLSDCSEVWLLVLAKVEECSLYDIQFYKLMSIINLQASPCLLCVLGV